MLGQAHDTPFGDVRSRHVGKPTGTRKVVTGRRDLITGEYPSGKPAMGYRMVAYEGLLSRDFIVLVENDPRVVSYQEEPDAFPWFDGECWHSYTPDFAVTLDDGRRICVEIKPFRRLAKLPRGFRRGVEAGAMDQGYDAFEIWTDREIGGLALANASLVASERTFIVDEAELHRMRVTVDALGGRSTIRDLRIRSGLGTRAFRAAIALVARRELVAEDHMRPLDDNAVLRRARDWAENEGGFR